MGKTPHLLVSMVEVVYSIWIPALEFGCVRLLPSKWAGEKWFATSGVMHWSLGG